MYKKLNILGLSLALLTFLVIVSCGKRSEPTGTGNSAGSSPVTISGVAGTGISAQTAIGKPDFFNNVHQAVSSDSVIANGAVTVFNKLGQIMGTSITDANGLFSLQVPQGLDYFIQVLSQDGETAVRSYLSNVNSGHENTIINAFTSTLVYAMEQRFNTTFANFSSGGFTGAASILTGANQIVAAAGFADLVGQVQTALAKGNVANGIPGAQSGLTAFLERLPEITGGNTGGNTGGTTITISAGSGLTPAYTFDGGAVSSLSVMRTAAPTTVVWGIVTPLSDGIASPLTHNTVGNGVVQTFSTETTLTAGVEYRVVVTRLDGSTGFTSFTPSAGDTGDGTGGETGSTGGTTAQTFTGSLTFSGTGASTLTSGPTFSPNSSSILFGKVDWTMRNGKDVVIVTIMHGVDSSGAFTVPNSILITGKTTAGIKQWKLDPPGTGPVPGIGLTLSGDINTFTFTDVQVPASNTSGNNTTLVINGTLTTKGHIGF